MVQQANSTQTLYKADDIIFDDAVFDGTQWTTKRFIAGGTAGGGEIMMRSGDSCERAATVLYHETWHSKQPPSMGWPHTSEDDAWYQTELWTIANNFPSQGDPSQGENIRTVDAKGNVVPDKSAIKKVIDKHYPVPPPAPRGWRRRDFKKVPPQTKWVNTATGATAWKPKSHGKTRVDDRRMLNGIIFINRNGLRAQIEVPVTYVSGGPDRRGVGGPRPQHPTAGDLCHFE